MLRLRNPSPEDLDPPPVYTDSDPAFSPDPMDNPHLYSYAMDASNADAKSSHLPRALIDDEKSRLKRAHKNTASTSASAAAAAAMTEEKTKRPPAAVHNNHQHHSHQHLSPPPPRITVAPSSSATSMSTMATSLRSSFVSSSFSSSSSSFSRLSPPSLYTGSPNSQTSLATSTGGSSPSSSPEAPPVKMPPASSLLLPPPPPTTKAPTTTVTAESKPVRPAITPLTPRRSRSVPRGGHGGASYDLDRIDELDESDPLGVAFHHGGPYEAIRAQKLNSPSSKKEEKQLWPGQHEWQKLPSNQQFSLDASLGLRPGQILPMEIKRMYDTGVVALPPPPPPSSSSSSLSLSSSAAARGMYSHDRQYLRSPPPQDARHPYRSVQAPPPSSSSGAMVGTHTDGTAYMRSHIAPSAPGEREKYHHQQQSQQQQQQQQQPQVQYGDYHRMGRSLHRHVIPEDSARPKVVGVQPIPPPPPSHALALAPATGHVHHPLMGVNTDLDPSLSLLSSSSAAAAAAAAVARDRFDTVQERRKEEEEDVHARALAHVKSSYSMKQQQHHHQHARAAEIADSVSIPQQVVTQPTRAVTPTITHVPEGVKEEGDEREVSELAYMRAGATPSPAPVQDAVHISTLAAAGLLTSSHADRAHSRSPSSSGRQQSSSVPEATEHVVITVPVRSPSSHEYASLHPQPSFHSQQTSSSSTSSSSAAHSRQASEPAYPSSAHHQYHHQQQQQDAYRTANNLSPSPAPPPAQPPTRAHTVSYQRTPAQQQPVQMRAAAVAIAQQSAIPPPDIRMPVPSIAPTASSTRSRQPAHVPKRLVMPTPLNPGAQGSIALANAATLHAQQQQQHQPHAEAFLTQHHVHFNEQQQSRAKDSAAYVARAREIPMADGSRKVLRKRTVTGAEQDHHHHQQQQQMQQQQQQQQQQQSRGRSLSLSFGRGKEKEKEDKRLGHAHSHSHSHSPSPLQQLPQQTQAQPLQPIVQRQPVQYQQQNQYPYQYQQQQQQQRQAAPQIRTDIMTYAPSKEPWVFHHHHPQQAQQHTQAPMAAAATTTKTKTRAHASQTPPPVQRNGSVAAKNMVPSQIDSSPWVHVSPALHPVKGLPTTATVFAVADRREMVPSSKGRRLSKQRRGDA